MKDVEILVYVRIRTLHPLINARFINFRLQKINQTVVSFGQLAVSVKQYKAIA